jgi:hypothetical protein
MRAQPVTMQLGEIMLIFTTANNSIPCCNHNQVEGILNKAGSVCRFDLEELLDSSTGALKRLLSTWLIII